VHEQDQRERTRERGAAAERHEQRVGEPDDEQVEQQIGGVERRGRRTEQAQLGPEALHEQRAEVDAARLGSEHRERIGRECARGIRERHEIAVVQYQQLVVVVVDELVGEHAAVEHEAREHERRDRRGVRARGRGHCDLSASARAIASSPSGS
jgi:hypothetical protein